MLMEGKEEIIIQGMPYRVQRLLGHGKSGYSYLVESDGKQYVLKAIHHEPCSYYSFGNKIEAEERDYKTLLEAKIPIPKMLFLEKEREIILKEFIEGPTVFDLVLANADIFPLIEEAKSIAKRAKENGINIDYFPTNFIVRNERLYYVDYECNPYMEQWDFEHWGIHYWSKTPEFLKYLEEKT